MERSTASTSAALAGHFEIMNLVTLLIPPTLDASQTLRLRRFGLAALSYALGAALVALAWAFGVLPASAALRVAAAYLAINLGLYAVIRSGFNLRFRKQPAQPEPAYLSWPTGLDPESVFCFKHRRRVNNDNTLSFAGHRLQIPSDRHRATYAGCRVEVRQHMDGCLSLCYQGRKLVTFEPLHPGPPQIGKFIPAAVLAVEPSRKVATKAKIEKIHTRLPWTPPTDHPWRKPFKIPAKPKGNAY